MSNVKLERKCVVLSGDLWERIKEAAREESYRTGEPVSASLWLRRVAEEALAKQAD